VQNAAINALKHFFQAYMVAAETGGTGDIMSKYLQMLTDPNVAIRRGSALALGVLPYDLLANRWRDVLLKLCSCCAIEVNLLDVAFVIEMFPLL
jgi:hypothetical protein